MGKKKPSGMRKARSLAQLLRQWMGQFVALDIGDGCEVIGQARDVSLPYGRVRLLFQPHHGSGMTWVGMERCRKVEDLPCKTATRESDTAGQPPS